MDSEQPPNPDQGLNELAIRELNLISQVDIKGESLLCTWSHVDSRGVQFINQEGKNIYANDRDTPKYWSQRAISLFDRSLWEEDPNVVIRPFREGRIHEVLVIKPTTKDKIATRKVKQIVTEKGFLGKTKQKEVEVEESYVAGQEPVTVSEATGITSDEPAATIHYLVTDWGDRRVTPRFTDLTGRPGNFTDFKLIVPMSLAEQVADIVREDPTFMRKLLFAVEQAKYPPRVTSEVLSKYGNPPYTGWEKQAPPKLYLANTLKNPGMVNTDGKLSFDPSNVIEFKTANHNGFRYGEVKK